MTRRVAWAAAACVLVGCTETADLEAGPNPGDGVTAEVMDEVREEAVREAVNSAVESFRAADLARDAEAVVAHLWPDFTMLVDGSWTSYEDVRQGTHEFMSGLELFHTDWTELKIIPLGPRLAVSGFQFRDSIITTEGELIQNRGPTTLIWEQRDGEWRMLYGDADHYPVDPGG